MKAVFVIPSIPTNGQKGIIGVWISEYEGGKFGLNVLNGPTNRGVLDVICFTQMACAELMQNTGAVCFKSWLQRCIVHPIRSSTRYVAIRLSKMSLHALMKIYRTVTLEKAAESLKIFARAWRPQYPSCEKSREEKPGSGAHFLRTPYGNSENHNTQ